MRSAKLTKRDIANLQIQRFLQCALPGGLIKGLKAYIAGLLRPMQLVDDAAIIANIDTAIVHVKRAPPVTANAFVNVEPRTMRQSMAASSATQAAAKCKAHNMRFYKNKKGTSSFFITRRYHDNYQHYNDNDNHNNDNGGNCSGRSLVNWCKWCSSYAGDNEC